MRSRLAEVDPTAPRIVIADGDRLVREILRVACVERGINVVGETADFAELVALCAAMEPDIVIASETFEGTGLEELVLEPLLARGHRVIVLSADPSPERVAALLAHDVSGYFSYDSEADEVAKGVVSVARGEIALNPAVASTVVHQWRGLRNQPLRLGLRVAPVLTPREHDVLAAMADGLSGKAIAARLGVALKTVENHKIRVFDKLGVRTQAQAVSLAIGYGLVVKPRSDASDQPPDDKVLTDRRDIYHCGPP